MVEIYFNANFQLKAKSSYLMRPLDSGGLNTLFSPTDDRIFDKILRRYQLHVFVSFLLALHLPCAVLRSCFQVTQH